MQTQTTQTIHEDTINLLRECNAGVKMGVSAIDQVLEKTSSRELSHILSSSKEEHNRLGDETRRILNHIGVEGKEPNPMAKGMSWLKTNVMLSVEEDDATIADLITDGCDMGVKSLSRYLNQYAAADEKSKDIAKKLIAMEADLSCNLRDYL